MILRNLNCLPNPELIETTETGSILSFVFTQLFLFFILSNPVKERRGERGNAHRGVFLCASPRGSQIQGGGSLGGAGALALPNLDAGELVLRYCRRNVNGPQGDII